MITYNQRIADIEYKLDSKRLYQDQQLTELVDRAAVALKHRIGDEIGIYNDEVARIIKGGLPKGYESRTFSLPSELDGKFRGINNELFQYLTERSVANRLLENLHLTFGTIRDGVTDQQNRINTLNQTKSYNPDVMSWKVLDKFQWMRENKELLLGLNYFSMYDLTERRMKKEALIAYLKVAAKECKTKENREKAKELYMEIEATPYDENKDVKIRTPETKFSEEVYGQDFTNH